MYEYEREREMLNMQFQGPEQQQPFHQAISEPADPYCRVSCHVHVEPPWKPVEPVWKPEPVRALPMPDLASAFTSYRERQMEQFRVAVRPVEPLSLSDRFLTYNALIPFSRRGGCESHGISGCTICF